MAGTAKGRVAPEAYEAWYRHGRGRWIGEAEYRLIEDLLDPQEGESVLDVGTGTGWFLRRLAVDHRIAATGLDPALDWLAYAATAEPAGIAYVGGDARHLPFADNSFDRCISVAALCFVDDLRAAVREIVRVTRKRFVIGLLNSNSLLYLQKGRKGGSGSYAGAAWLTPREVKALFAGLPVTDLRLRFAVGLPISSGPLATLVEAVYPRRLPFGAFVAVTGVPPDNRRGPAEPRNLP